MCQSGVAFWTDPRPNIFPFALSRFASFWRVNFIQFVPRFSSITSALLGIIVSGWPQPVWNAVLVTGSGTRDWFVSLPRLFQCWGKAWVGQRVVKWPFWRKSTKGSLEVFLPHRTRSRNSHLLVVFRYLKRMISFSKTLAQAWAVQGSNHFRGRRTACLYSEIVLATGPSSVSVEHSGSLNQDSVQSFEPSSWTLALVLRLRASCWIFFGMSSTGTFFLAADCAPRQRKPQSPSPPKSQASMPSGAFAVWTFLSSVLRAFLGGELVLVGDSSLRLPSEVSIAASSDLSPTLVWAVGSTSSSVSIWVGLKPVSTASCVVLTVIHPLPAVSGELCGFRTLAIQGQITTCFSFFRINTVPSGEAPWGTAPLKVQIPPFLCGGVKSESNLQCCLFKMFSSCCGVHSLGTPLATHLLIIWWFSSSVLTPINPKQDLTPFLSATLTFSVCACRLASARYWAAVIPSCLTNHLTGWRWTSLSTIAQNICFIPLSAIIRSALSGEVFTNPITTSSLGIWCQPKDLNTVPSGKDWVRASRGFFWTRSQNEVLRNCFAKVTLRVASLTSSGSWSHLTVCGAEGQAGSCPPRGKLQNCFHWFPSRLYHFFSPPFSKASFSGAS